MYFLQRIQNRISAFLDKKRLDAEMEEEMRGHVELQTRANLAAGMNPEEASRAARKEFGRADSIQEQCRDQRGTRWFEDLCQDLRFGIRQLRKNPGFTVVATLALAVGICAVTTQFTLFNGVLLRGLPFPEAGRLVNVALHDPAGAPDNDTWPAFEIFVEWQRHQRTCQKLAACDTYRWLNVVVEGVPRPVSGAFVTHDYFPVLGVAPLLGRGFSETDDRPGAEPVVMISHLMWQRDFGGRADVAGRTLRFEGKIATVIGVMPPGFSFPEQQQIWSPMPASVSPDFPLGRNVTVLARLKPGMTVAQATADFGGITGRMADRFPDNYRRFTAARVEPLEGRLLAGMRGTLEALLAAAVAVLLIACLNLMNLQFVRVSARMRELATRGALGAPRARLLRQMLTEGVVLVVAGSAIGVALTHWTIRLCRAALGQIRFAAMPDWVITSIDWNVLAFTLVATAGGVLASSLLPALFASRMDAMTVLRQSLHGQSNRHVARMGHGLVIAQIGLTCALLVASLLQVKSIRKHAALDFGFRTDSVMAGRLNLEFGYPTQPDRVAFYQRFLRELRIKPEFSGVAMTSRSLMVGGGWTERFQTESDATNGPGSSRPFQVEYVSDAYFSTLGLKPREGREFEPNERGRGERPA
ncbi:MAG TPA: ABC transporter permease, partial [Verrucomicrobiae bacterium]|nr:ABC transporter permease [Verrucomicrobiae bacterium]